PGLPGLRDGLPIGRAVPQDARAVPGRPRAHPPTGHRPALAPTANPAARLPLRKADAPRPGPGAPHAAAWPRPAREAVGRAEVATGLDAADGRDASGLEAALRL